MQATFIQQLGSIVGTAQLVGDPVVMHACQQGILDVIHDALIANLSQRLSEQFTSRQDMVKEAHEVAQQLGGEDESNGSLRDYVWIFRPVLKLNREVCDKCTEELEVVGEDASGDTHDGGDKVDSMATAESTMKG